MDAISESDLRKIDAYPLSDKTKRLVREAWSRGGIDPGRGFPAIVFFLFVALAFIDALPKTPTVESVAVTAATLAIPICLGACALVYGAMHPWLRSDSELADRIYLSRDMLEMLWPSSLWSIAFEILLSSSVLVVLATYGHTVLTFLFVVSLVASAAAKTKLRKEMADHILRIASRP